MLEEPGSQNQESHTGDVTTEHAPGAEVHLKPGRVPEQPLRAFDFGHFALILSQTLRDTRPVGLCFVAFMIWEEETWREGSSIDCPSLPWAPHLSLPGRMLLGSLGLCCGLPGVQWHWVAGGTPKSPMPAPLQLTACGPSYLLPTSHPGAIKQASLCHRCDPARKQ